LLLNFFLIGFLNKFLQLLNDKFHFLIIFFLILSQFFSLFSLLLRLYHSDSCLSQLFLAQSQLRC